MHYMAAAPNVMMLNDSPRNQYPVVPVARIETAWIRVKCVEIQIWMTFFIANLLSISECDSDAPEYQIISCPEYPRFNWPAVKLVFTL